MAMMNDSLMDRAQRVAREDGDIFVGTTGLLAAMHAAREWHTLAPSTPHRLTTALRSTSHMLPTFAFSVAVGILGMKACISAVSSFRQDFTRSSVLLALPLCGALLQGPRGPRAMGRGALGFGVLGYGAEFLAQRFDLLPPALALEPAFLVQEESSSTEDMGEFHNSLVASNGRFQ